MQLFLYIIVYIISCLCSCSRAQCTSLPVFPAALVYNVHHFLSEQLFSCTVYTSFPVCVAILVYSERQFLSVQLFGLWHLKYTLRGADSDAMTSMSVYFKPLASGRFKAQFTGTMWVLVCGVFDCQIKGKNTTWPTSTLAVLSSFTWPCIILSPAKRRDIVLDLSVCRSVRPSATLFFFDFVRL